MNTPVIETRPTDRAFEPRSPIEAEPRPLAARPFNLHLAADLQARYVSAARRRLLDRAADHLHLLTEAALADLERHLLDRLLSVLAPTIAATLNGPQRFWLSRALIDYPVLAELLTTVTDFWVEAAAQFLQRLATDQAELRRAFDLPNDCLPVTSIRAGLSEPHRNGQTVWQVTFDRNVTLFYKPRNLDLDQAWFDLLHHLNTTGLAWPFICPRFVRRATYGWMEGVSARPCVDPLQVERYCRRGGWLLGLLYLLGGSDFQHDNVIACADQPVLIDLETLLTPIVREPDFRLKPQRITATVLRTHFLSHLEQNATGHWQELGGLSAIRTSPDLTVDQAAAVQAGFHELADWLADHQAEFTAWCAAFDGLPLRVIFQDTRLYQRALRRSLQPRFLKNKAAHRAELERVLAVSGLPSEIARHEVADLEQLDIPYFETRTDTTDLSLRTEVLPDYFAEPTAHTLRRTLLQFDVADQARQIDLIQSVFDFKAADGAKPQPDWSVPPDRGPVATTDFEQAAVDLAEQIKRLAIPTASGATMWLIPEEHAATYQFRPCDRFLYQGSAGIALFLAAMETVRPGAGYGDLTRSALRPIGTRLPRAISLGAAHGLGSLIYACVKIGQWLSQHDFIEQAQRVAALITPERIAADQRLDVFDGVAGAILGLLALYDVTHDAQVLRQARLCGDHLLAQPTVSISGLAHGQAGIAYALSHLFRVTGDAALRHVARAGIAAEAASSEFWPNYCHGASGIGLARLDDLDAPGARDDLEVALTTTAAWPLDGLDFVCCGNFGRIELLLAAGQKLKRAEWVTLAREQAARLLARRDQAGGFRLFEDLPPRVVNPGLFRGVAGIGYELLRLAVPERWPNIWVWE
ncbi:MAG: type 2 lantipeptide synthetase LanM [Thermoflexales bacterium]|nr:type 2 lantipeptide synthetase LanM [Thermoflexales bacterium]